MCSDPRSQFWFSPRVPDHALTTTGLTCSRSTVAYSGPPHSFRCVFSFDSSALLTCEGIESCNMCTPKVRVRRALSIYYMCTFCRVKWQECGHTLFLEKWSLYDQSLFSAQFFATCSRCEGKPMSFVRNVTWKVREGYSCDREHALVNH